MWFLLISIAFKLWAIEPPGSAVDRAQALALKKNRMGACAILVSALEELPASAKAAKGREEISAKRAKIVESLHQISRMFFTDKGQKIFESGQSSMWENFDMALIQFREALALEDQNIQILNNLARMQLAKQDCDGAIQSLAASREINPLAGESAVLELRSLVCKQDFEQLREKAKILPRLDKWEESYVQYLLALDSLQTKAWRKSLEAMTKLSEEQPQFPESYLLLSKAGVELNKDVEPWLQKYVSLCKAVTVRERKLFSLEPRLCANLKEAEDELAKKKSL